MSSTFIFLLLFVSLAYNRCYGEGIAVTTSGKCGSISAECRFFADEPLDNSCKHSEKSWSYCCDQVNIVSNSTTSTAQVMKGMNVK